MIKRIFFFYTLFFIGQMVFAQRFDARIDHTTMSINGKSREGYLTRFDISPKKLEKAWWAYSRDFGRPLNMKGYYQVTIPSEVNGGSVNLVLFSKAMNKKPGSAFFLTLDDGSIPNDLKSRYLNQVKAILQSFKVNFYVDQLGEELANLEQRAAKVSKKVAESSGSSKEHHLQQLRKIELEIEAVKSELAEVNTTY